jgi:hypothetical protein
MPQNPVGPSCDIASEKSSSRKVCGTSPTDSVRWLLRERTLACRQHAGAAVDSPVSPQRCHAIVRYFPNYLGRVFPLSLPAPHLPRFYDGVHSILEASIYTTERRTQQSYQSNQTNTTDRSTARQQFLHHQRNLRLPIWPPTDILQVCHGTNHAIACPQCQEPPIPHGSEVLVTKA